MPKLELDSIHVDKKVRVTSPHATWSRVAFGGVGLFFALAAIGAANKDNGGGALVCGAIAAVLIWNACQSKRER